MKRLAAVAAVGILGVLPGLAAPAAASVPAGARAADGVVVKLRPGVTAASVAGAVGATVWQAMARDRAVFRLPAAASLGVVLAQLRRNAAVEWADPNIRFAAADTPNDSCLTTSTGCAGTTQWAPAAIQAPAAWAVTHGTSSVAVAVVDGGIDASHPDLAGKLVGSQDNVAGGGPDQCNEHGTHVAGTIAADTNNGVGVAGIGWDTRLIDVRVLTYDTTLNPPDCTGFLSDIARGIDDAVALGAKVVNLSLAGPEDTSAMRDAVANASAHNVVVVAAAGNAGQNGNPVEYPAALGDVISVAATDRNDAMPAFSDHGGWIDVAAPGVSIVSTVPGGYGVMSGTSMAAPHVSGVVALMLAAIPGLTPPQAAARLELSSDSFSGAGTLVRYGRVNAVRALVDDGDPGYYLVATDGGIFSYGRSRFFGSTGSIHLNQPIVGMAAVARRNGYWFVASDGGVFNYGAAPFYGSMGGRPLSAPIAGIAPLGDATGYFLFGADGAVYPFGAAEYPSASQGFRLGRGLRVVAGQATPTGDGLLLAEAQGGVVNFGDALNVGSMAGQALNAPIVGMAMTPSGNGYWLVGADGGIFSFGDARFFGSTGGKPLNKPIVGLQPTLTGLGYWLVAADGGLFAYGDARFHGSMGGQPLNQPVVGMS